MSCTTDNLLPKVTTSNGIEVTQSVTYQNWEPGKEYTKNIVLKNLKVKTQKLTYNTPESRFFSTLYPKQIVLSAGTTYQLPVTFRPLERDVYLDCIRFIQQGDTFTVPIKAVLPEFNISTPKEVNLPICAVNDETCSTFTIHNKSELVTPFQWNIQECFVIEPAQGVLNPRSSLKLTVRFQPKMARIYRCEAKCVHGTEDNVISTTIFSAVAKFPHLLVCRDGDFYNADSSVVVNFGEVPLGQSAQKTVHVHNISHVEAKCTIQQPSSMSSASVEKTFSCSKTSMAIPPNSSAVVPIKYCPVNVSSRDSSNISYFYVDCVSDVSRLTIKCQGTAIGPNLQLSTESVNFSLVDVGQSGTKVIEIVNQSAASSCYQFKIDCQESVFKFDNLNGRLAGGEKRKVIIKFCPTHAINYYKRVHCLIDNQDPLFLELLGTAHSETIKPAVLELKHLHQFKKNTERGLAFFPPEQLNEMLAHGKLQVDPSDDSLMSNEAESIEPWLKPVTAVPPLDLYFNDGYHSDITHEQPLVSLDTIHADFGRCENMAIIEPITIRLTNHTHGKIVAQWMGSSSHVFHVSPDTIELAAQKTADFRVTFKPDAPNNLYGNELECYCYYKSLRDYRLVDSLTHTPPICLTAMATGNTFLPSQISFLPQIKFSRDEIVFPATNQNEAVYQTVTISNLSNNPIVYDMQPATRGGSSEDSVVSVKPAKGIIAGKTDEIFVVRALPGQTKLYREELQMNMNNDKQYTQQVDVVCSAETADILLSNEGHVYFKQTCVGMSSCRTYHAKNISRMPLEFRWTIPGDSRDLLKVEPDTGLLMPNEEQVYIFTFTPTEAHHYAIKPALVVMAQGQTKEQSSGKPKIYPVRAIGEGTEGQLQAGESYIEFGNVVVGSSTARTIELHNSSDCTLRYRLCVEAGQEDQTAALRQTFDSNVLILDQYEGEISAQSKVSVRATVKPLNRCQYNFNITYQLVTDKAQHQMESDPVNNQLLLQASAVGVFPVLGINDARIHGSGIGISKKQLWSLFQLDTFNMYLNSDPAGRELLYSVQTRNSTRRRPPTLTRAVLDFNFGAAPVDTEPCHVTLHVENTGTVDCEWEFLFPNDLKIDLECWSEERDYTIDELHEMKVMDNKLFTVTPRKGRLEPGASCSITLTYKHLMAGTDRLPVLLKLSRGREILVNFVGVTTERGAPYIHFSSDEHSFAPVAIGEKDCPKQVYELYNGGSVPVKFEVDCLPLETLKSENFDHAVIECLTPRGVIQPGRSFATEWIFYPLEARTYQVGLPIMISGGETAVITFTGVGYDKKQLGDTLPSVAESNTTKVPPVQTVTVPGQLAMLSHERIALGNVPLYTKSRQVVFITNISDHVLSYSWHVTNDGDQKMVNVFPACGTLQPRASQMVKVTFTSWIGRPAAFYEMDMVCEVVDETGLATYRRKLGEWEDEKERQIHEFTITEKDLIQKQRQVTRNNGRSQGTDSSRALTQLKGNARDVEVTKQQLISSIDQKLYKPYKTLPPILDQTVDRERAIALEQQRLDALAHRRPSPPQPFLLHLGITARTHSIEAYQEEFFSDMNTFYIDRVLNDDTSSKPQNTARPEDNQENVISCDSIQKSFVTSMISNVLRSLVDDPSFHQSVTRLSDESTPYFNQFHTQMRPSTQPTSAYLDQELAQYQEEATQNPQTSKTDLTSGSATTLPPLSSTEAETSQPANESGKSPHEQTTPNASARVVDHHFKAAAAHTLTGDITRSAVFGSMVEGIIENTLANVLMEAASEEMNITARPRLIALPPRRASPAK